MQLISKHNKRVRISVCFVYIYIKCAWVVPLKDKKGITNIVFQKFLDEFGRKPNKIWIDQGSEFYNRSVNFWLQVVAERGIRTLKNKIYKHMTAVSKNVYIDKLDEIVEKCNTAYQ